MPFKDAFLLFCSTSHSSDKTSCVNRIALINIQCWDDGQLNFKTLKQTGAKNISINVTPSKFTAHTYAAATNTAPFVPNVSIYCQFYYLD